MKPLSKLCELDYTNLTIGVNKNNLMFKTNELV